MKDDFLLSDQFEESLTPVLRYKPAYALRTGIFSDLERLIKNHPEFLSDVLISSSFRDNFFHEKYLESKGLVNKFKFSFRSEVNEISSRLTPGSLIEKIGPNISKDIEMLNKEEYSSQINCYISGNSKDIFAHKEIHISPMVEIDTQVGPVIIDRGAKVSSFSILKGPLYIGENCILDKVLVSNTIIGQSCRLGGEISDSLIGDFTNKHHEGFLGHSIVGDWVNLGALTTTSDLKNNYGVINLEFKKNKFNTNQIKFGSIIGDCVKTGIGTMLNTGTIIDVGGLLFDDFPKQKYFEPFFWGGSVKQIYEQERFLTDITKIMARRKCSPSIFFTDITKNIYTNER